MLSHLTIRDLAVVSHACVEFGPGLNVLTGETGAGKSVIIDAIELLRGVPRGRARVREGASAATVEAQFVPDAKALERLAPVLANYDLPLQDELVLARRLEAGGRTRSYVQGRLVPRHVLAEVGEQLIEICGQHESHALRAPAAQLAALDRFAGLTAETEELAALHASLRAARARLEAARERRELLAARRELVEHQLAELTAVSLGDYAEARRRIEGARSGAERERLATEVAQTLLEGDDSVAQRVSWLSKRAGILLAGADAPAPGLVRLQESLSELLDRVHETVRAASALTESSVLEPGELEQLEQQVSELERLARKHRRRPEELAELEEQLRRELEQGRGLEQEESTLEREVARLEGMTLERAKRLHQKRKRAARTLEEASREELAFLCLAGASLHVAVEEAPLSATGTSQVTLRFSANPGSSPAPLGRVASGGELSRVLLALKVASRHESGTAIFDEIDAGAGGIVAERIGERLRQVAQGSQVICVTHWPQVAAFADVHLRVEKASVLLGDAGSAQVRTVVESRVARVQGEERIDELSRMLGGGGRSARGHAAHLVAQAQPTAAAPRGCAA